MEPQRNIVFHSERVVLHKNTRRPRPATRGIVTNFADLNIDIPEDSEDAIHQECLRQIGLPMTIDDSDLVPILPTLSQFSKVQIFRESPPCKRAASDQSNVEEPTQNTETNQTNNDQNSVVDNNLDEHNESVTTEGDQKSSSSEDDKENESWSEKSDDTHDDISVSSSVLSDDDEKTSSDNESNSESSREKSYDTDVLLASPDPNGRDGADDDNEAPVVSDDDDDVEIIEHKVEVIELNDSEEPGTSNQKPLSIKPKIRKKRTDNENTTFKNKAKTITITMADLEKEEEDDDTEMRVAETFEEYKPRKVKYKHSHPDIVVETASLASVEPVDVTYELSLPQNVIDEGLLSAVQLEAVVYASQAHEIYLPDKSRAGFFIGDGAGVGKGRTVAGIIYENYQKGRKCALWFSVSGDLKVDAERDLRDIGASCIKTYNITDMSYDDHISSPVNGNVTEGVIFSTYTSLISNTKEQKKYKSRIEQLLQWCGDNFDGVIIFDECHKAKNLYSGRNSSQTGLCVQELQTKLEKARVVYASATGASEPRDMAYMSRLGLWGKGTPFPYFGDFLDAVEKRGVSAMELVAMDMKQRGVYIARQLSFRGVDVAIKEVPMSDEFKKVYDDSTKLWDDARQTLLAAIEALKFDGKKARSLWSQFWSAHQRFFKYLCVSAKTEAAAQEARRAVAEGKCVVIGLQTTGEARTIQLLSTNQHTTHFVSIAKETFRGLVIKFPTSPNDFIDENAADDQPGDKRKLTPEPSGVEAKRPRVCPHSGPEYRDRPCDCKEQLQQDTDLEYDSVKKMKRELLEAIEELGPRLPPNPLDELIWRLGGTDKVAEMTGRVLRGVKGTEGKVRHERRAGGQGKKKDINLEEKDLFMDGVKTIAIISEAASSGISLQSDRRVKNKMRRVHITLELPWSADQAVQQFGRTHRSNQVNAPEYILLISDLAGERRFASTVAKRLESLGALTHGDRRATDTRDLSQFNINNKYGGLALSKVMNAIHQTESEDEVLVKLPTDYEGNFINDVTYTLQQVQFCEEKNYRDTTMFLNRILGIPVKVQNRLFKYFADTLEAVIQVAKRNGTLELGILELDTRGTRDNIQYVGCESFPCSHATGTASVKLHTLLYQPCMDWTNAGKIYLQNREPSVNGFYKPKGPRKEGSDVMLCISEQVKGDPSEWVRVYRPSTGRSPKLQLIDGIKTNETAKVKQIWETLYKASLVSCKHQKCDFKCLNGKNARIIYILSGSVLSVWKQVEHVLCGYRQRSAASFMKLVRLNTDDNKFIGILIPVRRITMLREVLAKDPQELLDMIDDRRNVPFRSLTIEKTTLEDGKATDAAIDLSLTKTPTMLDIPKKTEIKRFYDDIEDLEFLTKYRMTKNTVLQLLNSIQLYDRTVKLPIERQLLIALRYYATGGTFQNLSTIYDVSAKTVKEVIQLISEVIVKNLKHIFIKMPTKNEMDNHKEEFYRIAKFPNVIGCIDCTHVKIKMPEYEGQLYQNSRGWFSLNVQLVSDARLRIRNAVGNSYGSSKDADILFESNLFRKYLLNLDNSSFLLGDNAYPVMKNLLTPIANPENIPEANYNKSLIDTRTNTIGKLIDQLKRRFPVLAKGLKLDLQTSIYVINACCILHNICLDNNETMPPEEVHAENLHELISKGQIDNCYGGKQFKDDDFSRSIIISKYFTKK